MYNNFHIVPLRSHIDICDLCTLLYIIIAVLIHQMLHIRSISQYYSLNTLGTSI